MLCGRSQKDDQGAANYPVTDHPGLLKRLFELEVAEIQDGTVIIDSVAREPGMRSKIAVHSTNPSVDPVGACVGPKGMRVQTVVDELGGEKIDIVKYSDNPEEYVASALSPSKVVSASSRCRTQDLPCRRT